MTSGESGGNLAVRAKRIMKISLIDNEKTKTAENLSSLISDSDDTRIAVAFVSRDGLRQIVNSLETSLDRGAHVEFLVGMNMRATDPKAIRQIYNMTVRNPCVSLFCHISDSRASIYHPKLYLMRRRNQVSAIIGSSNLTRRGLVENIEINLLLQDEISNTVISETYELYNKLKFHKNRVIPDSEFIDMYEGLCKETEKQDHLISRGSVYRRLNIEYTEKVKRLKKPKPSRSDLVGWLELVYDSLPEGLFTNSQIYRKESEFKRLYPDNMNIRAKIRQQLQLLENLGFLRHEGTGKWSKIE
ncbi:MAG: phospholipase D-like domain-containing protein [Candidatus Zixiibacteriota bacterium]